MYKAAIRFLLVVVLIVCPYVLADQARIYGQWGNEKQCRHLLITARGTLRASPFDIGPQWVSHGNVWCRLTWISTGSSSAGVSALAHGLCGEDDLRVYRLRFELKEDQLTLHWNEQIENGPLRRCTYFGSE